MPQKWVSLHKEPDLSEVNSLLKGPILTQPHLVMFITVSVAVAITCCKIAPGA